MIYRVMLNYTELFWSWMSGYCIKTNAWLLNWPLITFGGTLFKYGWWEQLWRYLKHWFLLLYIHVCSRTRITIVNVSLIVLYTPNKTILTSSLSHALSTRSVFKEACFILQFPATQVIANTSTSPDLDTAMMMAVASSTPVSTSSIIFCLEVAMMRFSAL